MHLVPLLEQELGQVGTVLAGDAGDERCLHPAEPKPERRCPRCGHHVHMLRRSVYGSGPRAAYPSPHELDHADPAPRSGPLPRALVAVSNVLTRAARIRLTRPAPSIQPVRPLRRRAMPTTQATPCRHRRRPTHSRRDRPAGPAVHRRAHRVVLRSPCSLLARHRRRRAARRPGRAVRDRRGPRACSARRRLAVPDARPSAARGPDRARGPRAAALRAGASASVFAAGRPGRLPRRRDPARRGRHRLRPGGGPAQRGLRLLPGLRDVPADPPGRPPAAHPSDQRQTTAQTDTQGRRSNT